MYAALAYPAPTPCHYFFYRFAVAPKPNTRHAKIAPLGVFSKERWRIRFTGASSISSNITRESPRLEGRLGIRASTIWESGILPNSSRYPMYIPIFVCAIWSYDDERPAARPSLPVRCLTFMSGLSTMRKIFGTRQWIGGLGTHSQQSGGVISS